MSMEPQSTVRAEQPYAAIPIKVTFREWGQANAPVAEVFGWLERNRITPAGPLFYRYRVIGGMDEKFDIEVGVPVAAPITGDGRVKADSIPGGPYAVLTHNGHPDRFQESFAVLEEWAKRQNVRWANRVEDGVEVWGGRFEFFLTNPADQPDPEQWSAEIAWLVEEGSAG